MKKIILSLLLVSVLCVSFASAFWPFTGKVITGNAVIADGTTYADAAKPYCIDSDGGVKSSEAGYVEYKKTFSLAKQPDVCGGTKTIRYDSKGKQFASYPKINEAFCSNGKQTQSMGVAELGEGYCINELVQTSDNTKIQSAKWVASTNVCFNVAGGVKDQTGTFTASKKCTGDIYSTWACNPAGTAVEKTSESNCATADNKGKCTLNGCVGNCIETTDTANDINVAGSLTLNGNLKVDKCHPTNKRAILQYKCSGGAAVPVTNSWQDCGVNRKCVADVNAGAKCVDVYASAQTVEQRLADLESQVESILAKLQQLEGTTSEIPTEEVA